MRKQNSGVTHGPRIAIDGVRKSFKYHLTNPRVKEEADGVKLEELKLNMFNTLQNRIKTSKLE